MWEAHVIEWAICNLAFSLCNVKVTVFFEIITGYVFSRQSDELYNVRLMNYAHFSLFKYSVTFLKVLFEQKAGEDYGSCNDNCVPRSIIFYTTVEYVDPAIQNCVSTGAYIYLMKKHYLII